MSPCRVCDQPCSSADLLPLRRLFDAKLLFERCRSEFVTLAAMRCPASSPAVDTSATVGAAGPSVAGGTSDSGVAVAGVAAQATAASGQHAHCRAAFCRKYYFKEPALHEAVHCCWDPQRVMALFADATTVACGACATGLCELFKALGRWVDR